MEEPRIRGFICTTAHPEGCAARVDAEIRAAREMRPVPGARRGVRALVVGDSRGYGLSVRIALAFGAGARTLGVHFERPPAPGRSAGPGWWASERFAERAAEAGLDAENANADAFAPETVSRCADWVAERWGGLDLLIWSLAAPRGTDAAGRVRRSVLKPLGAPLVLKTFEPFRRTVGEVRLEPATEEEAADTVAVMGGAPWERWVSAFGSRGLLAPGFRTAAFSYEGPELMRGIYRGGTVGRAKEDLEAAARRMDSLLARSAGGRAFACLNQAVATQSSAVIPGVPLYLALLRPELEARGLWEDCGAQMRRFVSGFLFEENPKTDSEGRIRLDEAEMRPDVQNAVRAAWERVVPGLPADFPGAAAFENDFLGVFGFGSLV